MVICYARFIGNTYFFHIIYTGIETKLYRQIVGIPMGTNCAPLVANFILFCYFMKSLSDDNQAYIIEAFNSTQRYLDGLLKIDTP